MLYFQVTQRQNKIRIVKSSWTNRKLKKCLLAAAIGRFYFAFSVNKRRNIILIRLSWPPKQTYNWARYSPQQMMNSIHLEIHFDFCICLFCWTAHFEFELKFIGNVDCANRFDCSKMVMMLQMIDTVTHNKIYAQRKSVAVRMCLLCVNGPDGNSVDKKGQW